MPGEWKPLSYQPTFPVSTMLLLTDATVMCQQDEPKTGGDRWWRLTPDEFGNYVNGKWDLFTTMNTKRLFYASAVLADGRVFVAGGEYSNDISGRPLNDTNKVEIFDPVSNTWKNVDPPSGWDLIGDAPCSVLPDGRVLLGNKANTSTAIYDPKTSGWTEGPHKTSKSSEETWTLLPDGSVLTVKCNLPHTCAAERCVLGRYYWVPSGAPKDDLVDYGSNEIGPAVLLPNGTVFAIGAKGETGIYTPPPPPLLSRPSTLRSGTWARGPVFVDTLGNRFEAQDAPACLLPNGIVLCAVGPKDREGPTQFFEYDGTNLAMAANPHNNYRPPYFGRLLLLPTGQVLFAASTPDIYVYTPDGGPNPEWQPQITSCPSSVRAGQSYSLQGSQLNGLSQAVSYGDDATMATNYPLVRLHHVATGKVTYCRTSDHSTMGVATGSAVHGTNFLVPSSVELGPSELYVVANGIASQGVPVDVAESLFHTPIDEHLINLLIKNLASDPVHALGERGPVAIDCESAGLLAEAQEAWEKVIGGFRTLQSIAKTIEATNIQTTPSKAEDLPLGPSRYRKS